MNSPSPLVPQGAIPPKNTSRSARILWIGLTVVALHVGGLGLVLLQGCGKNSTGTIANASNTDTNSPSSSMAYPTPDTNPPSSMFASASNAPSASLSRPPTNALAPAPGAAFGTPTLAGGGIAIPPDANVAPIATGGIETVPAGPAKDYKVQKGDTLSAIASKNSVTLSAILKFNPSLDPKKLKVGQTIKIPTAPAPASTAAGATVVAGTGSTPPAGSLGVTAVAGAGTYKVKPGDTLTKIARAHGITVNQLRAANNMKTTQVQVGKVLKIPARTQTTAAAQTNTTQH